MQSRSLRNPRIEGTVYQTLVLALFIILSSLPAWGESTGRVKGTIEAGFDTFREKYSIVEEDTLDEVTEFRSRLRLGYLSGNRFRDFLHIEGEAVASKNNYDGGGRVAFVSLFRTLRFGMDAEGMVRRFRSNSTYAFPNDYERYNLRTYLQKSLTPAISLRLSDCLERMDFDQTTEFDYDYWKNGFYLSGDFQSAITTLFSVDCGYIAKSIPDTNEISYRSYSARFDFQAYPGLNKQILLSAGAERRVYKHKPAKSPFWSITNDISLAPFSNGPFGITLENSLESYIYDLSSDVYFSYVENKSAILASYNQSMDFHVRAGPTYAFLSSHFSSEDRYREIGGKLTLEYYQGTKIWISLSYEPGRRFYASSDAQDSESIFSDYTYNRLILFMLAKLWNNLSINSFLNHEPEYHEKKGDDSTITLLSLSLTYDF